MVKKDQIEKESIKVKLINVLRFRMNHQTLKFDVTNLTRPVGRVRNGRIEEEPHKYIEFYDLKGNKV
ncbi:hypothetical protein BLOT_008153 [Blomia tropicalis]|nr:hypothetical protein BLOT_008153 [Blomia tropicalis]